MPPRPVLRRPDGPTVHPVRHPDLDGRAEPDQHPVTAIEGLAEWLADHIAAGANVTVTEADGVLTISASGGSGGGSGAAIIAAPNADLDLAGQITAQRTIVTLPDPTPDWRTFTLPPTSELSVGDEITAVLREQLSYSGQGWLTYVASGDEIIVADGVTDGGGVVQTTPFVLAPMASTRWTFTKVAAGRWALGDPLITTHSQGDQNTVQVTDGNGGFYPAPGILAESGKLTVGTVDTPATMEVNGATPSTDQFLGHDGSALGWSTPTAAMVGAVPASDVGAPGGVAELDGSGLVLVSQLPAFVDDVLEFANLAAFPVTGESGKIYVANDTLRTYRWSGSVYVIIGNDLALGETSSTAYRGDRGKTAYDHSQVVTGNPHGMTAADVGAVPVIGGVSIENIGAIESNVNVVAATGATETLDLSTYGVHDCTMDQACTFTFSNPAPSGKATIFTLIVRGAFTPTLPASIDWAGTAPTYTTPSQYVFTTVDGGTTWLGQLVGKGFA